MKKHILLLLFHILVAGSSLAQTSVAGGNVNGTWTLAGSPYLVQGSIQIVDGDSLTIQPGVTVEFQDHYKLDVQGKLKAEGTALNPISFTAQNLTIGWLGIRFDSTLATNDSSRISYCKLEYGKADNPAPENCGGAIYIDLFSKVVISNCIISNCSADSLGGGIYCNGSARISRNTIENNTATYKGGGIFYNGNGTISDNFISNNISNKGMGIWSGLSPLITNNTISNNTGIGPIPNGGGIYCINGNPVISNNTITSNWRSGIFCKIQSAATITNNIISSNGRDGIQCSSYNNYTISGNTVTNNAETGISCGVQITGNQCTISNNTITGNGSLTNLGGGISCSNTNNASMIISNNTISNNIGSHGGAIYCSGDSNIIITNNVIRYNTGKRGGGIYSVGSSTITNNTISYNLGSYTGNYSGGGGIYCYHSTPTITNNIIANNTGFGWASNGGGGGIYCYYATPTISNNVIANNTDSVGNGGGINFYRSSPVLTNNTFTNNKVSSFTGKGGAFYCDNSSDPTFKNCIFYGNTAAFGNTVYLNDEASDPNFYYSDVEGSDTAFDLNGNFYSGIYQNNMDSMPLFVAPTSGSGDGYDGASADWSLPVGSPCVNTGNPVGNYPSTDIAGNPRIVSGIIDIGAYENQIFICIPGLWGTISPVVCDSFKVPSGDETYFTSGNYLDTIATLTGCDSIITINLSVGQTPVAIFTGLDSSYCSTDAAVTLTGTPPGGTFSGTGGLAGNKFYPATGVDSYTITYIYSDTIGCSDTTSQTVSVVQCTGLSEYRTNEIAIFPNPSTGQILIKIKNRAWKGDVEILDYTGRIVHTEPMQSDEQRVSLGKLPAGIYFVRIGKYTSKVLLQR